MTKCNLVCYTRACGCVRAREGCTNGCASHARARALHRFSVRGERAYRSRGARSRCIIRGAEFGPTYEIRTSNWRRASFVRHARAKYLRGVATNVRGGVSGDARHVRPTFSPTDPRDRPPRCRALDRGKNVERFSLLFFHVQMERGRVFVAAAGRRPLSRTLANLRPLRQSTWSARIIVPHCD